MDTLSNNSSWRRVPWMPLAMTGARSIASWTPLVTVGAEGMSSWTPSAMDGTGHFLGGDRNCARCVTLDTVRMTGPGMECPPRHTLKRQASEAYLQDTSCGNRHQRRVLLDTLAGHMNYARCSPWTTSMETGVRSMSSWTPPAKTGVRGVSSWTPPEKSGTWKPQETWN